MRRILSVLFAVNALNIYDRVVLGAVLEPLRHEFHLSDSQLGALVTWFTVIYAVAGLPAGRLADRGSRRRVLAWGVTVWALLTASAGVATSYAALLISRLGVGIGEAACAPAATSWIGDVASPSRRARALALFMLGVPVGTLFSFAISGPVAQAYGWRAALLVAAAPALLLVPLLLGLPEAPRAASREAPGAIAPLLRVPAFRTIILSGALVNFSLYALSTFLPAFLTRHHGLTVGEAGVWTGLGLGAAGLAGGIAVMQWGDREAHPSRRLALAAAVSLIAAPIAALGVLLPAGALAAIPLLVGCSGLLNMYYGLVYAAIQDITPPRQRGAAMSVYFLAMYLCGGAFGPLLTGRLSDWLARNAMAGGLAAEAARAVGLQRAMLVVPAMAVVLAATLWRASRQARSAA